MIKTIYKTSILFFLLTYCQSAWSQVTGISYTLSPTGEYARWDDKAGLEDGLLLGGKFGFGFGEYFELRGSYMQSNNLKTNFSKFGLENFSDSLSVARDVKMSRWGGEIKANLGRGKLLPYLVLGTGIQNIEMDTFAPQKQIYLNAGLGITVSLADRYTLTLEARNTAYRFNTTRNLLTDEDRTMLGLADEDLLIEELKNWSLAASLQFYLGGRRPGKLSDLDKAYFNSLTGGLNGLRGTLEPVVGTMRFHENLPYRNATMAGINAGIDIGPYIGLRGFYSQALQDGEFTKFDKLSIYGGEMRMRLNANTGLVPYVMLGGGKIDVENDYVGKEVMMSDSTFNAKAEDKGFAMGGLGILMPLSKNVNIFGSARALLTTGSSLTEFGQPDDLQTSWYYSAGFRFSFGKKAADPNALVQTKLDDALLVQQTQNDMNAKELKSKYEAKIVDLDKQLNQAYEEQDAIKAAAIQKEKEQASQVVNELNLREIQQKQAAQQQAQLGNAPVQIVNSGSEIRMTPAEFENLVDEILDGMGDKGTRISPMVQEQMMGGQNQAVEAIKEQELNRRLGELEKLLVQMNEKQNQSNTIESLKQNQTSNDLEDFSQKLYEVLNKMSTEIEKTNKELKRLDEKIDDVEKGKKTSKKEDNTESEEEEIIEEYITPGTSTVQDSSKLARTIRYGGMSGFVGFSLGGSNTLNVGFRTHYPLGKRGIVEFMPEAFFGVGSSEAFGISANLVLPIKIKSLKTIRPYIGGGVGIAKLEQGAEDKARGVYNIILGSYLKVGKGRLYVDLTARNLFKNNQLIAGYRFPF